jgi:hypothetical protein
MTEFLHQVVKKRENPCTFLPGCTCQSCISFAHMWDDIGDPWALRVLRRGTNPDITIEAI